MARLIVRRASNFQRSVQPHTRDAPILGPGLASSAFPEDRGEPIDARFGHGSAEGDAP